jgi:hypothetical protein
MASNPTNVGPQALHVEGIASQDDINKPQYINNSLYKCFSESFCMSTVSYS